MIYFFKKYDRLLKYLFFSCIVSVVDYFITFSIFKFLGINYIISNTIGILCGFILHFCLSIKIVFKAKNDIVSFLVYFSTFLLALYIANVSLWLSFEILYFSFITSKLISMAVPFLITYFLRKYIYVLIQKSNKVKIGEKK